MVVTGEQLTNWLRQQSGSAHDLFCALHMCSVDFGCCTGYEQWFRSFYRESSDVNGRYFSSDGIPDVEGCTSGDRMDAVSFMSSVTESGVFDSWLAKWRDSNDLEAFFAECLTLVRGHYHGMLWEPSFLHVFNCAYEFYANGGSGFLPVLFYCIEHNRNVKDALSYVVKDRATEINAMVLGLPRGGTFISAGELHEELFRRDREFTGENSVLVEESGCTAVLGVKGKYSISSLLCALEEECDVVVDTVCVSISADIMSVVVNEFFTLQVWLQGELPLIDHDCTVSRLVAGVVTLHNSVLIGEEGCTAVVDHIVNLGDSTLENVLLSGQFIAISGSGSSLTLKGKHTIGSKGVDSTVCHGVIIAGFTTLEVIDHSIYNECYSKPVIYNRVSMSCF